MVLPRWPEVLQGVLCSRATPQHSLTAVRILEPGAGWQARSIARDLCSHDDGAHHGFNDSTSAFFGALQVSCRWLLGGSRDKAVPLPTDHSGAWRQQEVLCATAKASATQERGL